MALICGSDIVSFLVRKSIIMMSTEENENPLEGRPQKKKNNFDVFDHQIHQKFATDVIGVSFDAQ